MPAGIRQVAMAVASGSMSALLQPGIPMGVRSTSGNKLVAPVNSRFPLIASAPMIKSDMRLDPKHRQHNPKIIVTLFP